MKNSSLLTFGLLGVAILGLVAIAGYMNARTSPPSRERIAGGSAMTEEQKIARRRGAIGTVAVAGTTAQ